MIRRVGLGLGLGLTRGAPPLYEHDFTKKPFLPQGFALTRSSLSYAFGGASTFASRTLQQFAVDTPAFEWTPYGRGLLLQGARTNKLLYNDDLTQAIWTKRGVATAVQTGGWWRLSGLAISGANDIYQSPGGFTTDVLYSPSFYIKRVSTTGVLRLMNPATALRGDWSINLALVADGDRITASHPAVTITTAFQANTNTGGMHFAAVSGGPLTVDILYPQAEEAAFPSSPILTTGSTVTRAADTCSRAIVLPSGGFSTVIKWIYDPAMMAANNLLEHYVWCTQDSANTFKGGLNLGGAGSMQLYHAQAVSGGFPGAALACVTGLNCLAINVTGTTIKCCLNGGAVQTVTTSAELTHNTERLGVSWNGTRQAERPILCCNASPTRWRPPVDDATLQRLSGQWIDDLAAAKTWDAASGALPAASTFTRSSVGMSYE